MTRHRYWFLFSCFAVIVAVCLSQNPHVHSPSHPADANAQAKPQPPAAHAHAHAHGHGHASKLQKWKSVPPKREPARYVEGELAFDQVNNKLISFNDILD